MRKESGTRRKRNPLEDVDCWTDRRPLVVTMHSEGRGCYNTYRPWRRWWLGKPVLFCYCLLCWPTLPCVMSPGWLVYGLSLFCLRNSCCQTLVVFSWPSRRRCWAELHLIGIPCAGTIMSTSRSGDLLQLDTAHHGRRREIVFYFIFFFILSKLLVPRLTEVLRNIHGKQQFNYSNETFVAHRVCCCVSSLLGCYVLSTGDNYPHFEWSYCLHIRVKQCKMSCALQRSHYDLPKPQKLLT